MRLRDIGQVAQYLAATPISEDPVWDLDSSAIRSMDLTLFRARMSAHGLAKEGDGALEVLQSEALKNVQHLGNSMLLGFNGVPRRFMVDELLLGLGKLKPARAQAALFALEETMHPDKVLLLTWRQVLNMSPKSQLGIDLIRQRNRVRHLRLNYVFWEFATDTIASPLLDLQYDIEQAFGMEWGDLVLSYENILMVDTRAEAASFQALVQCHQ